MFRKQLNKKPHQKIQGRQKHRRAFGNARIMHRSPIQMSSSSGLASILKIYPVLLPRSELDSVDSSSTLHLQSAVTTTDLTIHEYKPTNQQTCKRTTDQPTDFHCLINRPTLKLREISPLPTTGVRV